MEEKKKSPTKLKKKYRAIKWSCFVGMFVSTATPFVAMAIVNYDKYFVEYSGTKMSISFLMAMAVMGFALWGIAKEKLKITFVTFIIAWATFAFVFQMLGEIILDLAQIMWFGLIGLAGAFGLNIGSKVADKKLKKVTDGIEQAEKENISEAYKQEVEEKRKVKIRIKK